MFYTHLSSAAQTVYAALASANRMEDERSVAALPGSFSRKKVKGKEYWYYQTSDLTGKQIQIFLGAACDVLNALVERHRQGDVTVPHLRQLGLQAIAAGCPSVVPAHAKVLQRLADIGFFRTGGILIGTHAYMAYQNYLGVRWQTAAQAQDLDFAHVGRNISVAIPSGVAMDVGREVEALKSGFVPVKSLTTYMKSDEKDLHIDFVTCMDREGDEPVLIRALDVVMQPLRFVEFLMANPVQLTVLAQRGPIAMNAPTPERYALHKLLVYGERHQEMRSQARKDLDQAASLIRYLAVNDPELLHESWADLVDRGPVWKSRAQSGLKVLTAHYPDVDTSALIR